MGCEFLLRAEICTTREFVCGVLYCARIGSWRHARNLRAAFLFPRLLRLTVLLRGAVMLHMVRISTALVVPARMVRVRSLGAGVRRRLHFLRSQRDQRRRRK